MKTRIFKALSIMLAVVILCSTCICAMGTVSAGEQEFDYYVAATAQGTGDGSSPENAASAVCTAIETAVNSGEVDADDTVYVNVLGSGASTSVVLGNSATLAYDFKVVLRKDASNTAEMTYFVDTAERKLFGNMEIQDVYCYTGGPLHFDDKDFTVDKSAIFQIQNQNGLVYLGHKNGTEVTTKQTVTFNGKLADRTGFNGSKLFLTDNGANKTYNADLEVVVNNAESVSRFYFTSSSAQTTTYNKNVNLNIKNAASLSLNKGDGTVAATGALQIINSAGSKLTYDNNALGSFTTKYILTNDTGNRDILTFTDTAGKFAVVGSENVVYATKNGDPNETAYISVNGVLDLTAGGAGEYTVKLKTPSEYIYYVGEGASPNGETVYETIADVIYAANNNSLISASDVVVAYILGNEKVEYSNNPKALLSADYNHEFTLKITAEYKGTTVNIADDAFIDGSLIDQGLVGDTIFDNVTISTYRPEDNWQRQLYFNGHNVTFNEDTTYVGTNRSIFVATRGDAVYDKEQTVTFNNAFDNETYLFMCSDYGTATYNENLNVVFNNSDAEPLIYFPAGTSKAVYNKDINFVLNNGATITKFRNDNDAQIDGIFRVITDKEIDATIKATLENIPKGGFYTIYNKIGVSGAVQYTDTAGKIKVEVGKNNSATITGPDGDVEFGDDGCFTLGNEGEYTVTLKTPKEFNYYVGTGVAPNGETVYETIADVIYAANSNDDISSIDTVIANVLGNEKVEYSNNPDALLSAAYNHSYTLKITAEYKGTGVNIASNAALVEGLIDQSLMGDTIFDNVTISTYRPADDWQRQLYFNGHNVTFNEDTIYVGTNRSIFTGTRGAASYNEEQTVTFNNPFDNETYLFMCSDYGIAVYNENLNVIFNNPEAEPLLNFGSTPSVFNKDINFVLNGATVARFRNDTNATIDGTFRVITDNEIAADVKTVMSNIPNKGFFVIYNKTNVSGVINYTDTAGKIAVDLPDFFEVTVNGPDGDVEFDADRSFTLGSEGEYKVTAKDTSEGSKKMLYYKLAGGSHHIETRVGVQPGESYVMEYSVICSLQTDTTPVVQDAENDNPFLDPSDSTVRGVKSFTSTKMGDYYRIVAQITIPENYPHSTAFFGTTFGPFTEGYIFDRTVYKAGDATKTDLFEGGNADFSKGLDYIKCDISKTGFWAPIWNPLGLFEWNNGSQFLEVMSYNATVIKDFVKSLTPEDGKWWSDEDIMEDEFVEGYATAKGVFKDSTGKGINGAKMILISEEKEYSATTNSNGEFDFGKILSGFYDLYVLDGSEKIFTGFSQFISPDDEVTFNVTSDISNLVSDTDYEEVEEEEEKVEEITPSGNLSGTVYTPYLETVANLKLYLEGIGEVTTDENGNFAFADVPVGKYKLYTVLEDESEYVFRDVEINENVDLKVKLKYDPPKDSFTDTDPGNNGWIIWVIVASVVALVVVAGLIFFLVFKKKKA